MSFKEHCQDILEKIEQSSKGEKVSLESILKEIAVLFQEFQVELKTAEPEEKKTLIKMMNDFHLRLKELTQSIGEQVGMSEEDLIAYAQNPSNFSPFEAGWIERSKNSIESISENVAKEMHEGEEKPKEPPPPPSKKSKRKRPKRSDWRKS